MKKVLFSLSVLGLFANADAMQPDQQTHAAPISQPAPLSVGHIGTVQAHTDIDEFKKRKQPIMSHNLSSKNKDYTYTAGNTLFIGKDVRVLTKSCLDQHANVSGVKRVVFEPGSKLERIDDEAFARMNIEEVSIPDSVRELGSACFLECESLKSVTFGAESALTLISPFAFARTNIISLNIPNGVRELGHNCFKWCESLKSVTFGNGSALMLIPPFAFHDTAIESLNIPNSVKELGDRCFGDCINLRCVTFGPDSQLEHIGQNAFIDSPVERIEAPKHLYEMLKQHCPRAQFVAVN